ncbi:MAG: hypothetical protein ACPH3N_10475 [Alcanivorax sediminis]|uniref:DUF3325 domain-containing protein n=1 Tax=Alcanivorax sediminis TaxID=2663008 RepID=A0A6N7LT04_9GAMM|nr:hypothetical protein [Alcanivorax sediminis]MQX52456.1 hypothetical protein [Alcanivorax sediminis]
MAGIAASLLTLVSAVLLYLTDREQRLLTVPLAPWLRLVSLALLTGAAGLWVLSQGVTLGLMVGLWVFVLAQLVLVLLVGHYRDSFQKTGGRL